MTADRYNVIFSGQISPTTTRESARRDIKETFKLGDAQLDNLFSGQRIVVKREVSLEMAKRYQSTFSNLGALTLIEPLRKASATGLPTSTVTESETTSRSPIVNDGGLTLAPIGSPLDEIDDRGPPQTPNTASLSLVSGPEWSLQDCEPPAPKPPELNINHLKLVQIDEVETERTD
ncbi:MAG TPA: hypothetical protein DDY14_13255 [Chromatiaceae bacterium]|jgi:hypothetical protein|nr:MAG: hypothetical protein N838_05545 [Thiohalocapsa sp. PB-PSB1]QQO56943.1 MAG: hypothetical protein N838_29925 [Thiohalocapsa sp. PB-PSB1]HBG96248.1 hypothetical protein [Chromatiaceae bacterium]